MLNPPRARAIEGNEFPGPHSWVATPGPRQEDPNFNHSLVNTNEAAFHDTTEGGSWKLVQYVYPEQGHPMEHQWEDNGDGHFRGLRMMVQAGEKDCEDAFFDDFCVCRTSYGKGVLWCCGPGPFPATDVAPPVDSHTSSTAAPTSAAPTDSPQVLPAKTKKSGASAVGFLFAIAIFGVLVYRESVLPGGFLVKYRGNRRTQHYTIASNDADDIDDGGVVGGMDSDGNDDDVALVEMN